MCARFVSGPWKSASNLEALTIFQWTFVLLSTRLFTLKQSQSRITYVGESDNWQNGKYQSINHSGLDIFKSEFYRTWCRYSMKYALRK